MDSHSPAAQFAAIYNQGYLVRMFNRPGQREERAQALHRLGLICRDAFNSAQDYEPLFVAIVDVLSPRPRDF